MVPGLFFSSSGTQGQEVELIYEHILSVPETWRKLVQSKERHVLVEFDSVDYRATVQLISQSDSVKNLWYSRRLRGTLRHAIA